VNVCSACGHANSGAARFCEACATPLVGPVEEHRKIVSALFCDVVGSTALGESVDPEALQGLLARYFEQMQAIVARHGGVVEKFIGDAVMAVFGIPTAHEDDALRACRAAIEMRSAFSDLGVQGRIGVNTGEVVTGTSERLATGDAVNVAARLQQAAAPDEVLIGEDTLALVRNAVEVEPLEPLVLKGKAQPVAAFRLVTAHEFERRHEAHFVGRDDEVTLIRDAWTCANTERRCELVTIVGEAGVGKSRLVAETLATIDARVVQGRCLPYGDGITYWPVAEVVKQLGTLPSAPTAAAALRVLLGEREQSTTTEEICWGFRKLLEEQAPVVTVFDDLQWGDETFLDLVESVALLSSEAPILLLCLARPELLMKRREWPVALRLEPLGDEDVAELIGDLVSATIRDRIALAAGGNPLFVTEMLAMAHGGADVDVPPTLRGLLAARLDQLDPVDRRIVERAAIEGETFHRGAVRALAPDETQVTHALSSLVRRELIRPDKAHIAGEDGFRFRHLLIRDAAYDGIPKAIRADLHVRYADWLEERGAGLAELDQLLGYHLEQAHRYRVELGRPVDRALATRARNHLTAAGRRAYRRRDEDAALSLYLRAAAFLEPGELDLALEYDLELSHFRSGDPRSAIERSAAATKHAAADGDQVTELALRVQGGILDVFVAAEGAVGRLEALVAEALPKCETAGDHLALAIANHGAWTLATVRGLHDDAAAAADQALEHAQLAGFPHYDAHLLPSAARGRWYGSTPIPELLDWLDAQGQAGNTNPILRLTRASALAMQGRRDEAQSTLGEWRAEAAGETGTFVRAFALRLLTEQELSLGNFAAAAELAHEGCVLSERGGDRADYAEHLIQLGEAHYRLGRLADAERSLVRAAEIGAGPSFQAERRALDAKIRARRGDCVAADRLAREAVAIADATQYLNLQAQAYADLGEVLALAGETGAAREALKQALERYGRKGNLVGAERARARLAELRRG